MIKTIIFDFGDVFINLDKVGSMQKALDLFDLETFSEEMVAINSLYEQGLMDSEEFLDFYLDNFSQASKKQVLDAWNAILLDFPPHRLEFIQKLSEKGDYKLILLSNTNALHIDWIKENVVFYEDFKVCFDAFYLSHEIGLRKPNADIYQFVLKEHKLNPTETLFIDDTTENIEAASKLGIHTWHINPEKEDITELFNQKSIPF